MKSFKWVAMAVVVALVILPVLAGEGHKKCEYDTQECLNYMANKMKNSGWVGVELDADEKTGYFVITRVIEGSPAEASGLMAGDAIFAVNGVRNSDDDQEAMWNAHQEVKAGQSATWSVKRNGAPIDIELTLAPMPADMLAKFIGEHMMQHASVDVAEN